MAKKKQTKKPSPQRPAPAPAPAPTEQPPNPDFEAAVTPPTPPEAERKDGRGGARPGAGRPPGMTDEKARVKNLPRQPNQTIKQGVEMLFTVWAKRVKVNQIRLSDTEADTLALPLTQLQDYYFPDAIPEIAWVWLSAAGAFVMIVDAKIRLIEAARAAKPQTDTGQGSDVAKT